ncbi:hypothetical protein ACFLW1_02905 [Chloroflexota bacterium]
MRESFTIQRIKQYVLLHRGILIDLLLIAVIGTLAISWFRGDFLILYGDFDFYPEWHDTFFRTFYSWDVEGMAVPNTQVLVALMPYEVFRTFTLGFLGLSPVVAEKILFYLCFTMSGLSMYYLVRVTSEKRRLVGLVAAFSYMFNPYNVIFTWGGAITYTIFFYASFPLILALFIKGLNERRGFKYIFFFCLLWMVTTNSSYVNPKWMALTWLILGAYLIFYILTHRIRQNILPSLRFSGVLFASWVVLNLYWLIPNFYALGTELRATFAIYKATGTTDILAPWLSGSLPSIGDAMRLSGFWGLYSGVGGDPFYNWAASYSSPLLIFISFLMPVLAFFSLATRARNKYVIFFTLVALFIIFQLKGPNPPLGDITRWFYTNIPLVRDIGISPFANLSPALTLSYSFLIGHGIDSLYHLVVNGKETGIVSSSAE